MRQMTPLQIDSSRGSRIQGSSIWGNDDEDVIKDCEGDRSMGQSRLIPRYYIYLDPAHLVTKDSDS